MKNLAIAVGVLIVVLLGAFVFTRKGPALNDTLIPSPTPISTPALEFLTQGAATKSAMQQVTPFSVLSEEEIKGKKARIETTKGDIVFEFFADSPLASSNFIALANKKFYDGLTFHRREEGFVIQGGDPLGNGTGGPGYKFADEPVTRDYLRGTVAMANAGPNTNGSQFFIMLADSANLPKAYTIFGQVVEGQEVVDKIMVGDKMTAVSIE